VDRLAAGEKVGYEAFGETGDLLLQERTSRGEEGNDAQDCLRQYGDTVLLLLRAGGVLIWEANSCELPTFLIFSDSVADLWLLSTILYSRSQQDIPYDIITRPRFLLDKKGFVLLSLFVVSKLYDSDSKLETRTIIRISLLPRLMIQFSHQTVITLYTYRLNSFSSAIHLDELAIFRFFRTIFRF